MADYQYMPYERMMEHVRDTYGAAVWVGTLVAMVNRGKRVLPVIQSGSHPQEEPYTDGDRDFRVQHRGRPSRAPE